MALFNNVGKKFKEKIQNKIKEVGLDEAFLQRAVNEGFSGGEKKRNEVLQMLMLEPNFIILDETDSGLDVDALRIVADGINRLRRPDRSILLITHYQRILKYVEPDFVHVFVDGRIARSGGKVLAEELEEAGYNPTSSRARPGREGSQR